MTNTDHSFDLTEEDVAIFLRLPGARFDAAYTMVHHDHIDAEMAHDWRVMRAKDHTLADMATADVEALELIDDLTYGDRS